MPEGFALRETVTYPNGEKSTFWVRDDVAVIVDDGICDRTADAAPFDYSLITSKQNAYVHHYARVFRLLREDLAELDRWLETAKETYDVELQDRLTHRPPNRADIASASPLEMAFERHFVNAYGEGSERFLQREYAVTDLDGHTCFVDYVVNTADGLIGVEENGISYHHPQVIGIGRYRRQLLKQNSCTRAGIKLYRFSTENCRFGERLEDDILSFFGRTPEGFQEPGMLVDRDFALYEHQEGALDEMVRRRACGVKSFLAVFPTASGKSRIVEEDIARFAPNHPGFRALICAPNTSIVDDWNVRLAKSLPRHVGDIVVCTYGWICRHYMEYQPEHFSYIVIDEAHHAVAPALRRTIQHFDPVFLVGLTATDQRPDKKSLEEVFGSYRVGLSLADAMERGIVARARAYRIESNVDLSHVRVNGRDYVNADLEKTLRVTSRNGLIVDFIRDYFCDGESAKRQGVVFCASVRHAKEMERLLNGAGISTRSISGQTRRPERVMAEFREGRARFLCSCQMISEGWDYPELGILVMARPTLSRVLYLQQLGRGLRRTATKREVIVVDVVDEYGTMAAPCSLHSVMGNPYYVPFGDVLRRDYEPGEWVEVDGIRERVERIVEVDVHTFAERYEGWLSVEQVARDLFVNTGTVNAWIRRERISLARASPLVAARFTCSALRTSRASTRSWASPFTTTRPYVTTSLLSLSSVTIRCRTRCRFCFRSSMPWTHSQAQRLSKPYSTDTLRST